MERLQAAVGSDLLDENDDDLDQEEEEQLSDEAIKKAEAELQAQGDTSFSEAADKTLTKDAAAAEVHRSILRDPVECALSVGKFKSRDIYFDYWTHLIDADHTCSMAGLGSHK